MHIVESITELQQTVRRWRQLGEHIAFVPTMGNLHAGHLNLVKTAQSQASRVMVSIFVNPTQFGPNEDFDSYPRTLSEDLQKLRECATDALFLPTTALMYSENASTTITVAGLSERHCGAARPGHFNGVATVVTKLFNLVQPDSAFFGEKDFQQLAIIRKMVADLNSPVIIQGVPTVREADGLAMSSRNGYLTAAQRQIAPLLYQCLCAAKSHIIAGQRDYARIETECLQTLTMAGFEPDYLSICRASDLQPAKAEDHELVILAAARLGKPRLIDNVVVNLENCANHHHPHLL